jgi:hypothetical protein
MSNDDTYDAMAARIDAAADELYREADNAAEILPTRAGGDQADPQQWADRKRAAATAAREYAAELRAVEHGPQARLTDERRAQAERVADAAELGGILIDGRAMAERNAHSDRLFNEYERDLWDTGTHPTQDKAREIDATGKFTHVADTIDGIEQVPFWQLGQPTADVNRDLAERTTAAASSTAPAAATGPANDGSAASTSSAVQRRDDRDDRDEF